MPCHAQVEIYSASLKDALDNLEFVEVVSIKKNVRFVLFLIVIFNIINHWRDYLDPVHWYSFIFHHCTIPLILQFAIFSLFAYLLIKFERFIKQCVWSIFPKSKLGHLINDDGMQKNTRNETPPQKTT